MEKLADGILSIDVLNMSGKILPIFIYFCIALIIALIVPLIDRRQINSSGNVFYNKLNILLIFASLLLAIGYLGITAHTVSLNYLLASIFVSFGICLLNLQPRLGLCFGFFLGTLIIQIVPWWRHINQQVFDLHVLESFELVYLTSLIFFILCRFETNSTPSKTFQKSQFFLGLFFLILVIVILMSTNLIFTSGHLVLWHNWSAYIGPAQLIQAGAIPLHDIPLQYGLGPNIALALACRNNCWLAMYWLIGATSILWIILLAWIALSLEKNIHPIKTILILASVFISCLLWTAIPANLYSPLTSPSTVGMRYLPGVSMLAYTLWLNHRNSRILGGHLLLGNCLWCLSIIWSPEAAIQTSSVWVPCYLFQSVFQNKYESPKINRMVLFKALQKLFGVLVCGLVVFLSLYWLVWESYPKLTVYLAYLLHPPGPLPINLTGTIWFAITILVLWFSMILTRKDAWFGSRQIRSSWLILLYCLGVFPYFLGRSHDNNLLNLMPYFSLLLLSIRASVPKGVIYAVATTLFAGTISMVCLFRSEQLTESLLQAAYPKFLVGQLVNSFTYTNSYDQAANSSFVAITPNPRDLDNHISQAIPALRALSSQHSAIEILDAFYVLEGSTSHTPWSALHGIENYVYMPSELRIKYLKQFASRSGKSGWLIFQESPQTIQYIKEYDLVYRRRQEIDFYPYKAIYFEPK
jgi:hypothetical protein